jgi:hypothetical protein
MSQWTHVSGIIRIDDFISVIEEDNHVEERIENIIAKINNIPTGSEGPLEYDIVRTRTDNEVCFGYIAVYGDLRDYENVDEIYDWFDSLRKELSNNQIDIRSLCVKIDVEFKDSYIIFDRNECLLLHKL